MTLQNVKDDSLQGASSVIHGTLNSKKTTRTKREDYIQDSANKLAELLQCMYHDISSIL